MDGSMIKTKVRFIKTHPDAKLPARSHADDVGFDLYAVSRATIPPCGRILVSTGLDIALPIGYEGQVRSRSGMALKFGVSVLNSPGTIDPGYRGSLGVILQNHSRSSAFVVDVGDRVAQLVIVPVESAITMVAVDEFEETDRSKSGFGSTGA